MCVCVHVLCGVVGDGRPFEPILVEDFFLGGRDTDYSHTLIHQILLKSTAAGVFAVSGLVVAFAVPLVLVIRVAARLSGYVQRRLRLTSGPSSFSANSRFRHSGFVPTDEKAAASTRSELKRGKLLVLLLVCGAL